MTKTTDPATVSPDTAPDTEPDQDTETEQLVADDASLEERLAAGIANLIEVLLELPAGHPDTLGAYAHLEAFAERAAAALPIPPATAEDV
ncbi:hypothetical protein ASE14_08110 [Agromyces sp. Root81]|uniref:hypothetical protein n=1 Tax=Agromyces sp. Root81 TaxID=1736601 RepID=UPI0006F5C5C3|nr:hypothetical protein [Agromyces sp. Root81]KRC60914.1 hypothetical protein ASE14_08110 [Agromyces sp. Root81]